jgi:dihydroorotate dehydrogenase electron transfer subunit
MFYNISQSRLNPNTNAGRNIVSLPLEYFKILKSYEEANDIHTLIIESEKIARVAKPGQYMILVRSAEDTNPMSFSLIDKENGRVGITFRVIGESTREYASLKEGDNLGVQYAPCGNGFSISDDLEKVLIIGGGVGLASLTPLIDEVYSRGIESDLIAGFKTKEEAFFLDRLSKKASLHITTDDGSFEQKGTVLVALKNLDLTNYQYYYCVGREEMMYAVLHFLSQFNLEGQFSLERYIKCGLGVCGSCAINGLLVCQDGPVFTSQTLRGLNDFGKVKLDLSAVKIPIGQPYSKPM